MEWATDAFDKPRHCAFVGSLLKSSIVCSFSKLLALLISFIPILLQHYTYWLYFLFYSLLPTDLKIPKLHGYKNYYIHMHVCIYPPTHLLFCPFCIWHTLIFPFLNCLLFFIAVPWVLKFDPQNDRVHWNTKYYTSASQVQYIPQHCWCLIIAIS